MLLRFCGRIRRESHEGNQWKPGGGRHECYDDRCRSRKECVRGRDEGSPFSSRTQATPADTDRSLNAFSTRKRRHTSSWKPVVVPIIGRVWAARRTSCLVAASAAVRPYVSSHRETDRADAAALLEAVRNPQIRAVTPKTIAQQELLALHRIRAQWMSTRTDRINAIRGFLNELGLPMARARASPARQRRNCWRMTRYPSRFDRVPHSCSCVTKYVSLNSASMRSTGSSPKSPPRISSCSVCNAFPASGCSRRPPWWPPLDGLTRFARPGTLPAGLVSHRRNARVAHAGGSGR